MVCEVIMERITHLKYFCNTFQFFYVTVIHKLECLDVNLIL